MKITKEKLETIKEAVQYALLYTRDEILEAKFAFLLMEIEAELTQI